ncbi:hypothetical protein C8Q76DRAFT_735927 [Earliella scabrosa]|nr:hypothetical protein C8Q76DRAFT_735927 [Earliella scabrosa]
MYVSRCTKSYYGRHWCRWKPLPCRYKERTRVMRRILHCQSRAISSGLSNTLYLYRVHTMIAAPQETNLDTTVGTANMIGVVLSTITYGAHLTLFCSFLRRCIDHSSYVGRSKRLPSPKWPPMAYAVSLFILATTGFCLQTWLNHEAFIRHRNDPGGALTYIATHADRPGNRAVTAVYVVLNWFSDGMLLYRFFAFFRFSSCVRAMSVCMLLSLIVLGGVSLPNISMLSANLWTDHSTALSLAYLTLSLSINVVLTITIACRLLKLRNTFPNFLGDRSGCLYTYIVTMFVESASLYSIVAIVTIVACGINSPIQNALLPMLGQLQAIPPLVITVRIMECRAVPPESFSTQSSTTLNFRCPVTPEPEPLSFSNLRDSELQPPPYAQPCMSRSSMVTLEKSGLIGESLLGKPYQSYASTMVTSSSSTTLGSPQDGRKSTDLECGVRKDSRTDSCTLPRSIIRMALP